MDFKVSLSTLIVSLRGHLPSQVYDLLFDCYSLFTGNNIQAPRGKRQSQLITEKKSGLLRFWCFCVFIGWDLPHSFELGAIPRLAPFWCY